MVPWHDDILLPPSLPLSEIASPSPSQSVHSQNARYHQKNSREALRPNYVGYVIAWFCHFVFQAIAALVPLITSWVIAHELPNIRLLLMVGDLVVSFTTSRASTKRAYCLLALGIQFALASDSKQPLLATIFLLSFGMAFFSAFSV